MAFGTFKPFAEEIARLKAENEALRFRLDELLCEDLITPIPQITCAKFAIVNLLAKRSPTLVPDRALFQAMTPNPEYLERPEKMLRVHISRARKYLKPHGIEVETIWGLGYRMPPESKAKWQALLNEANGIGEAA